MGLNEKTEENICRVCGNVLDSENWLECRKRGRSYICKVCNKKVQKEYRKRPEVKKYQKEHKKEYYEKPGMKERQKFVSIKRIYNITKEEYEEMYISQDFKCKICKEPFSSTKSTHLDHNHETGKVRGLICTGCNTKVGCIESPLYEEVLKYLEDN